MGVGVFLAYISEGSNQRDPVAQLLLVLMVVAPHHGLPHLLSHALLQLTRRQHAVDHHVCMGGGNHTNYTQPEHTFYTHREALGN